MKAKKNKYFKHFSLNTARVSTLNTKLADDRADPPQLIACGVAQGTDFWDFSRKKTVFCAVTK